jgi:hypothetical protein
MADHEPRMTGTKVCTKCLQSKPVLAFPVRKEHSDGLDSWCRQCNVETSKQSKGYRARRQRAAEKRTAKAMFARNLLEGETR